ncbi:hypothetical protein D3C87_1769770 [compost metagenome]|jgi:hypothetical protein
MENTESQHTEDPNKPHKPIEHDYPKHQDDPGPSRESIEEKDINGAAVVLRWLIPILVIALAVYWFVYIK